MSHRRTVRGHLSGRSGGVNYWTTVVALFSRCGEKKGRAFLSRGHLEGREEEEEEMGERFDYGGGGGGNFGSGQGVLFPPVFPFLRSGTPPPKVVVEEGGERRRDVQVK